MHAMTDNEAGRLIKFLRDRLDEDERIASAATPGPWRYDQGKHWRKPGTSWFEEAVFAGPDGADAICVAGTGETDDWQSMADAEHVALHDPARALREVEANREIVSRFEQLHDRTNEAWSEYSDWIEGKPTPEPGTPSSQHDPAIRVELTSVLRILATTWANHPDYPDYPEEWRP